MHDSIEIGKLTLTVQGVFKREESPNSLRVRLTQRFSIRSPGKWHNESAAFMAIVIGLKVYYWLFFRGEWRFANHPPHTNWCTPSISTSPRGLDCRCQRIPYVPCCHAHWVRLGFLSVCVETKSQWAITRLLHDLNDIWSVCIFIRREYVSQAKCSWFHSPASFGCQDYWRFILCWHPNWGRLCQGSRPNYKDSSLKLDFYSGNGILANLLLQHIPPDLLDSNSTYIISHPEGYTKSLDWSGIRIWTTFVSQLPAYLPLRR